ncbi:ATP synthase subunit s-like protein [Liparis tanakae]|uniref:ATP synthase subunit s-like protein n=1 Tax=Liparis tanakae TaxID=230148 RepID=A0A4Z2FN86_9TELE|nr:ATP synthase subunit s-like protein [Liparis tanakae]
MTPSFAPDSSPVAFGGFIVELCIAAVEARLAGGRSASGIRVLAGPEVRSGASVTADVESEASTHTANRGVGLRRLDVSALPGISSPGLLVILLEEMLPQCQVIATGYEHSLSQERGEEGGEEREEERGGSR